MRFKFSITIIAFLLWTIATQSSEIPNRHNEEKTSKYKGVYYHKQTGTWCVLVCVKGQKQKYGGRFNDELDAAKRVNQLCEELKMPLKNPGIAGMPNQQSKKKKKTSQYKGVFWHKSCGKWYADLCIKGEKKYGGSFHDELDAAKKVNQLCEEFKIPPRNPGITGVPNQQSKKRERASQVSQHKGVYWQKDMRKWRAHVNLKGGKQKYGGYFSDELNAARKVNQLCEELKIPLQNPEIVGMPNQQSQTAETQQKTSQYKGVYYHKQSEKWYVLIYMKGQKSKYGGLFNDELDAAKQVNQLCEELKISPRNPGITGMPNQQWEEHQKNITI